MFSRDDWCRVFEQINYLTSLFCGRLLLIDFIAIRSRTLYFVMLLFTSVTCDPRPEVSARCSNSECEVTDKYYNIVNGWLESESKARS